ncbi:hypothetical protein L6164_032336 [Bauhinia variegata]|uniref:Uncharacterized protein n=1 Tax=Bauhinia variegata TaxID=167791 RepID=A0ACB9KNC5_BAUVA|nr:hypothetical protein L6164_032336 [Bauhinia variegata]
MSYFCGCHPLVMLLLCFVVGSPAAGEDSPLFMFTSRQEMVRMAGYGEEKVSTVLVTGSVLCDAQSHAWPIPGALVAVNCHSHSHASKRKDNSVVARGVTDEFGEFFIDLPSYLHAIPNLEKLCSVKVRRIPKRSMCRPTSVKRHGGLQLSSFGIGIRTYGAGNIRFQHSTSKPLHA